MAREITESGNSGCCPFGGERGIVKNYLRSSGALNVG